MQKKIITKVIPEQVVQSTVYVCDNCGSKDYDSPRYFSKCECCGKETCPDCREVLNLFTQPIIELDKYGVLQFGHQYRDINHSYRYVCNECFNKLPVNYTQLYLYHVKKIIDTFNQQLSDLNTTYLKGELR